MLGHHLYSEPFPALVEDINQEFDILTQYLCLGSQSLNNTNIIDRNSVINSLNWTCEQPKQLIQTWSQEYISFASKSLIAAQVSIC